MTAIIKETLHKMIIAFAFLWFWESSTSWTIFYVYPKDLETTHERLTEKRIKITIEIVDEFETRAET